MGHRLVQARLIALITCIDTGLHLGIGCMRHFRVSFQVVKDQCSRFPKQKQGQIPYYSAGRSKCYSLNLPPHAAPRQIWRQIHHSPALLFTVPEGSCFRFHVQLGLH